jgi:H+/Cl- antiporter ClcA
MCIYLGAAALTGAACVLFMHSFEFVYSHRLDFERTGWWSWLTGPLLFLVAIELIRRVAPCADGAGIPQTIFAARHLSEANFKKLQPLVSFRTMFIKVAALLIGLWAGASTGREGPTVHIAACLFFGITYMLHRVFKLQFNMRSAVVAGGAAGLAAAFNTPLAGVTFAIEELTSDSFASIKEIVLMAIIVAGLAAKALTGEYVYFGRLHEPAIVSVLMILMVGVMGGLGGTVFSALLIEGRRRVVLIKGWKRYAAIALFAWAVLFLATASGMKGIAGPGNIAAQGYLRGNIAKPCFPHC